MPDVKFFCKNCGKKLAIDASAAGLSVDCPKCGTKVRIPKESEPEKTADPAPALKPPPSRAPAAPPIQRPAPPKPPPPAPTPAKPSAPAIASPPPVPAENAEQKKRIDELTKRNRELEEELSQVKQDLAKATEDAEKQRSEVEKLSAAATRADVQLKKDRESHAAEKKAWEDERAKLQEQLDASSRALAEQKQKSGETEAGLKEKSAAAELAGRERDEIAGRMADAEKKAAALDEELKKARAERDALKKERDGLLVHRDEAKTLSENIAGLKTELKELREQEASLKKAVVEAENRITIGTGRVKPAAENESGPWKFDDPFRRSRRWLVVFAGIAMGVVLCSVFFLAVLPALRASLDEPPPLTPADVAVIPKPVDANQAVKLGEPFVIDEVEVVITRPRVAPVDVVSLLGNIEKSDTIYLILDVRLVNRSADHELYLRKPWEDARLVDAEGRRYRPAFATSMQMRDVQGITLDEMLPPGGEIASIIVFEWDSFGSTLFELDVDPGFKRLNEDGRLVQISFHTFELSFTREDLSMAP